jgi:hypothetical protein
MPIAAGDSAAWGMGVSKAGVTIGVAVSTEIGGDSVTGHVV